MFTFTYTRDVFCWREVIHSFAIHFQPFISKMNIHLKFVLMNLFATNPLAVNWCIIHVDQMGKFINSFETSIAASKLTLPFYLSLSLLLLYRIRMFSFIISFVNGISSQLLFTILMIENIS